MIELTEPDLVPGVYKIPVSLYREIDAVNFSSLKHMGESAKSYLWHKDHPIEETAAMAFGTAFHSAVLEPDKFADEYVCAPEGHDGRTKEGKAFKAELEAQGQILLSRDQMAQIQEMAGNFRGHPLIGPYLTEPGTPEITFIWNDAETGLLCKGRLDRLLDDGRIFGVKTTTKFNARQFASHAWELAYQAQWAFYYDGAIALGLTVPEIVEGVVSTNGPYDAALYVVDDDILKRGRIMYRSWLRTLANCLETGKWPGQYPDAITFRAPAWAGSGEFELEDSIGSFVDLLRQEVK